MKHYLLILFDPDGILVDSIHRIVTSLQYASRYLWYTIGRNFIAIYPSILPK